MRRSSRSTEQAPQLRTHRTVVADESGSASLEFLTVGLLLLVPIVYLVLSIASIQAGAFAVEGAARHAARIAADGAGSSSVAGAIDRAVRIALDDFGIDADAASVTVSCETDGCNQPGERIDVAVRARVALPFAPEVLGLDGMSSVPVESRATQTVSRFVGVE